MKPEYGKNVPYLTVELANDLVEKGAAFVGVDTHLIDDLATTSEIGVPIHYIQRAAINTITANKSQTTS